VRELHTATLTRAQADAQKQSGKQLANPDLPDNGH